MMGRGVVMTRLMGGLVGQGLEEQFVAREENSRQLYGSTMIYVGLGVWKAERVAQHGK